MTNPVRWLWGLADRHRFLRVVLWPAIATRRWLRRHSAGGRFDRVFDHILARAKTGSIIIDVPDFMGAFEIDLRSDILRRLLKHGFYTPGLAELVKDLCDRNRDAVDVGANVGLFSILMSRLLEPPHRVLAIEPSGSAVRHLAANAAMNNCQQRIEVFSGVATNTPGQFTLHTVPGMAEYCSLGQMPQNRAPAESVETVAGETVDALVSRHGLDIGFMKVRAEGSEFLVLDGARQVLASHRPVILSQLSEPLLERMGNSSRQVVELLTSCGYRVLDAETFSPKIEAPFRGHILAVPNDPKYHDICTTTRRPTSDQFGLG